MGMIDRGAELEWISQYPFERECLFAPLTGLEVQGVRVESSVLVIESRLSINLNALTIEQVISKRHRMVKELCSNLIREANRITPTKRITISLPII